MAKDTTAADGAATPESDTYTGVVCVCEVLVNGLTVAGATAAAGAIVNLKQADAQFHEDRNEVKIKGTL